MTTTQAQLSKLFEECFKGEQDKSFEETILVDDMVVRIWDYSAERGIMYDTYKWDEDDERYHLDDGGVMTLHDGFKEDTRTADELAYDFIEFVRG